MPAVGISIATQAVVGKAMGMGRPDIATRADQCSHSRSRLGTWDYARCCFVVFREQLIDVFINEGTSVEERTASHRDRCSQSHDRGGGVPGLRRDGDHVDGRSPPRRGRYGLARGGNDRAFVGLHPSVLGTHSSNWHHELGSVGPWIGASLFIIGLGIALEFPVLGRQMEDDDLSGS